LTTVIGILLQVLLQEVEEVVRVAAVLSQQHFNPFNFYQSLQLFQP
jgi:hypothetical protein